MAVKVIGDISVWHGIAVGFSKSSSVGVLWYVQSSLYGVSYSEIVSVSGFDIVICSCEDVGGSQ